MIGSPGCGKTLLLKACVTAHRAIHGDKSFVILVNGAELLRGIVGDTEAVALAKRNPDWAVIVDAKNAFDKRPNTWMIRHGDVAWKNFLDSWCNFITANGEVQRLFDKYAAEVL